MGKIKELLMNIFAIGMLLCFFAGALLCPIYIVAMFIGGETATSICLFAFGTYLPWVIRFTSIFAGIGLLGMYLSKQKALTVFEAEDEE